MMADLNVEAYDEILFIGKSVGTIVAVAIAEQNVQKDRIQFMKDCNKVENFGRPKGDTL